MGFTEPCFRDSDDDLARQAWRRADPRAAGLDWESLKRDGWRRLARAADLCAVRAGQFPHAVGQVRILERDARGDWVRIRCPTTCRRANRPRRNPELARRYPLAFISPPARNFLNSSFANLPAFVAEEKTPKLDLQSGRCRGARVGSEATSCASATTAAALPPRCASRDRARPGVAVAPSIWWQKLAPDGCNANAVTSQALTDMGRAATFYDCLVEVERA